MRSQAQPNSISSLREILPTPTHYEGSFSSCQRKEKHYIFIKAFLSLGDTLQNPQIYLEAPAKIELEGFIRGGFPEIESRTQRASLVLRFAITEKYFQVGH